MHKETDDIDGGVFNLGGDHAKCAVFGTSVI